MVQVQRPWLPDAHDPHSAACDGRGEEKRKEGIAIGGPSLKFYRKRSIPEGAPSKLSPFDFAQGRLWAGFFCRGPHSQPKKNPGLFAPARRPLHGAPGSAERKRVNLGESRYLFKPNLA